MNADREREIREWNERCLSVNDNCREGECVWPDTCELCHVRDVLAALDREREARARAEQQADRLAEAAADYVLNESPRAFGGRWYALAEALLPADACEQVGRHVCGPLAADDLRRIIAEYRAGRETHA